MTPFCSTASLCGPRNTCPVGTFIPHPSLLSSSFLYLPSEENHPLEILLFQHNLFDFKSPKVCFPILSLPGNYSPRSPRGHPNSRHKRWLFPGCGWTFAYSIPQPMCSPLLKHGASSPPRPTSPRKASPLSLAEGVSLCHEGLAYSTYSSRTHPRGQMCPPCTLKNICFLLRCQRLLFIYF